MEHYITIAISTIGVTLIGIFGVIKACDWLISLKYRSKEECSHTCHELISSIKDDFATKSSVNNMKEDMKELKDKVNDIHDVIMTFAVSNFKERI